jgi:hypothetical protein
LRVVEAFGAPRAALGLENGEPKRPDGLENPRQIFDQNG